MGRIHQFHNRKSDSNKPHENQKLGNKKLHSFKSACKTQVHKPWYLFSNFSLKMCLHLTDGQSGLFRRRDEQSVILQFRGRPNEQSPFGSQTKTTQVQNDHDHQGLE